MKRFLWPTCVALLMSALVVVSSRGQGQQGTRAEGLEPYTPTRMEWLLVECRDMASLWHAGNRGHAFSIAYLPSRDDPNEVVVSCLYDQTSVDREQMNEAIDFARGFAETLARKKGWTWVTTGEKVKAVEY